MLADQIIAIIVRLLRLLEGREAVLLLLLMLLGCEGGCTLLGSEVLGELLLIVRLCRLFVLVGGRFEESLGLHVVQLMWLRLSPSVQVAHVSTALVIQQLLLGIDVDLAGLSRLDNFR